LQKDETTTDPGTSTSTYTGTGSVTQGKAATTTTNLFASCNGRVAGIGTITSTDKKTWTVPADVDFTKTSFPFASDLSNSCSNHQYTTEAQALAALTGSDVVTIDADGDIVTAYIFADNYFEVYINGVPVGKDPVPYTPFNSSLVRFKVKKPYTVAVKLVDWEENLGLGSENNGGFAYKPGDGGLVVVFKNKSGVIEAVTNSKWKAQTFYTAPVKDLSCLTESGTSRLSASCNTDGVADGSTYYGVHWVVPADWYSKTFDDSAWPTASTYSNATVGVDNKPEYTNFSSIFDNATSNADFIWSTNLLLDNLVIVRYTVQ
jgi:hypothetical protein